LNIAIVRFFSCCSWWPLGPTVNPEKLEKKASLRRLLPAGTDLSEDTEWRVGEVCFLDAGFSLWASMLLETKVDFCTSPGAKEKPRTGKEILVPRFKTCPNLDWNIHIAIAVFENLVVLSRVLNHSSCRSTSGVSVHAQY
jgi:hypothetical protein